MDSLVLRVAARFLVASLEQEFIQRFQKLLDVPNNPTPQEVTEFRTWMTHSFNWDRTPRGAKREKDEIDRFWRSLSFAEQGGVMPGAFVHMFGGSRWSEIQKELPRWVQLFTTEGGAKEITREKKVGGNTYVNMVSASDDKLDQMISTIEGVFHSLTGWRQGALSGGVKVIFAGPKDFHGTASGRYNVAGDTLWIRATPGGRIEKGGSGYGGLAYVIVHELGHRYEHHHHVPYDFDRHEWQTSRYSMKDGEAFAELFALSNFGITAYHPEVVAKFDHLMSTGKMPA